MTRMKRSRPSPALIVAVVALVAALAGTAVAADPVAQTSAKPVTKKKAKKIANKQIDKRLPITSEELGDINTRTTSATVTNTYSEQTANCESGERVISGGVKVDNAAVAEFTNYLFESYKQDEGWYARALIIGTRNWTVEAYCLEE